MRHIPFTIYLLISTIYYTIIALVILAIRVIFTGNIYQNAVSWTDGLATTILATLGISFIAAFVLMLMRMLGPSELMSFFTGRYHKPVEEEHVFMFLDIVSSTTIAEKIGPLNFHIFLNDFIYDITDAILSAKGKIYKYVGDEVIISWKLSDSVSNSRCIQLYFEIKNIIEKKKNIY